jgi:hypothetical protein
MEDFDHVKQEEPNNLLFINVLNFFMFLLQALVVTVWIGQFGLLNFSTRQEISQSYPTLITAASWIPATVIFALIVVQLIALGARTTLSWIHPTQGARRS